MDHGMMMTMQQKQNGLYKTQICKHYKEGNPCNMADKCSFAHGEHELRGKDLGMMMPQMAVLGPTPYNNYKTKKCKFFTEEGACKYGNNCTFAHGTDARNPYDEISAEE